MTAENEDIQDLDPSDPAQPGTAEAAEADSTTPPADDAPADADPEEPKPEEIDPLSKALSEAEKWRDAALRSQAELENFRKRMAREKSEAIKYGNAALIESLLPVIDNFNFGLQAARQESADSVVFQGMSMVFKQMQDFLSGLGVAEIAAEGQKFDPNIHEAIQQSPSDDVPEGMVISVIRRGFILHDRLLRAAHVVVSTGPAKAEDAESSDTGS